MLGIENESLIILLSVSKIFDNYCSEFMIDIKFK